MATIDGGHAIMLRLGVPGHYRAHSTLVFVGRDQTTETGEEMLRCARKFNREVPEKVIVRSVDMFGPKQDKQVLRLESTEELLAFRQEMCDDLCSRGVKYDSRWPYSPHYTLECLDHAECSIPVDGLYVKLGKIWVTL